MQTPTLEFVLVHVSDLATVRDFYAEKLGMELQTDGNDFVQFRQPGGVGASLALSSEGQENDANTRVELWWFVQDVDAAKEDLAARGVEATSPIEDMPFGRTFSVKDPEGNVVYLLQPRS